MNAMLTVMLLAAVQAVEPLTPAQQTQLDTATDHSRQFDEGALYPLLHNALKWDKGDEAGATIPDYAQIMKAPPRHRGRLFLIEGLFAGVPRGGTLKVQRLTRPGPWDDKLEQWVIVVDPAKDEVAVVYLVDPPPPPSAATKVRLVGRFYKVLQDFDRSKPPKPTDYLLFVGNSATVLEATGNKGWTLGATPLLGVLVITAGAWFFLRRMLHAKSLTSRRLKQPQNQTTEPKPDGEAAPELPKDPADALRILEHQEQEDD